MATEFTSNPMLESSRTLNLLLAIIGLFAGMLRVLLLAVFALLEPIVWPTLCATALLTLITAFFFRFLVGDASFPFWGMIGLSVACMLLLDLYYRFARLLCGAQNSGR